MPPAAAPGKQEKSPRAQRAGSQPLEYQILLTVTLCLLAFGAVMVYSASSARTLLPGHDGTSYLIRYVAYGAAGLVLMRVLAQRGLEGLPRLTGPLLVVAFGLLVAVRIGGVEVNGAKRWLGAGPLQFQPAEIMKVTLVLYAARLLGSRPEAVRRPRELVPLAVLVILACGMVASQPDLGTSLVIAFTAVAVLIAAGIPVRHLAVLGAVGIAVVAVYAMSAPYRRARLTAFADPWAHAGTIGYQFVQGQIAIGSGGFFGRGLGQSVQKIFYLPEAHTDFILAIIGEELGVAGIFSVLMLYGMFAYAGLRIAQRAAGRYATLLAVGLTSLVMCQAALNAFAVLGVAPLTGVPLPFISYGSTNLVVLLAAVGLLLNISVTRGVQLKVADDPPGERGSRDGAGRRTTGSGGRPVAGAGGPRLSPREQVLQLLRRPGGGAQTDGADRESAAQRSARRTGAATGRRTVRDQRGSSRRDDRQQPSTSKRGLFRRAARPAPPRTKPPGPPPRDQSGDRSGRDGGTRGSGGVGRRRAAG
jgi:cell division protein FtsW